MKKIVLVLLVALMGTTVMNAQPPRGAGMIQDRVAHLEKELSLTKEQKAQITEILKEGMSQMKIDRPQMKEGEKPDPAQMSSFRERFQQQQAAMDAQIEKVLTPEQFQKYTQLKKEEPNGERPQGHGPKGRHLGERPHGDHHKMVPKDGGCCQQGNKDQGCCDRPKGDEKPSTAQSE